MAYYNIVKRPRADGVIRYRCTVGIKESGKHLHRETKTFGKMAQAKSWGSKRAAELEENGIPSNDDATDVTVRELIYKYLYDPNLGGKAGRTKVYVLNMLKLGSQLKKWHKLPGIVHSMYYGRSTQNCTRNHYTRSSINSCSKKLNDLRGR
ncbi:hypothetical protein XIS1_840060 [Xenorhabdus innexi]|uniref:Integrase n=1 Tax=Xenorhabdus innexi TaxID=290109 RepID=A0A1N6N112_9GAMM|nr:integrase [Xenorhabdus innexi]SIP74791.1 hypothetical protein XIS1_840060 [Xenorhabdus innexi]